jgi:hypothetical protein
MRAKRDYAMLALLFGCGFRRSELVGLELDEIQMRQGHWAVVDLIGKGGHIRTVPIPQWVKAALDQWIVAARVTEGRIFRRVARAGKVWGKGISQNVVWYVVKTCCERAGLEHIAPHDLRRTCAKLCHTSGGELEQIQFLLGHASVQTTERYLGCKQNLGHPVNDLFDLAKDGRPHENDAQSAPVKSSYPVEKAFGQGIECGHGGSEHEQCQGSSGQHARTQGCADSRWFSMQPLYNRARESLRGSSIWLLDRLATAQYGFPWVDCPSPLREPRKRQVA